MVSSISPLVLVLVLSHALCNHVHDPRAMFTSEAYDVDETYIQCPAGNYQTFAENEARTTSLQNFISLQQQDGWRPIHQPESACSHFNCLQHAISAIQNKAYRTRGRSVYESANWPKPPECASISQYMSDKIDGNALDYARIVFGHKVEFIHNFKAAGISLIEYFKCEYGDHIHQAMPEKRQSIVSVMAVRNPINRFASGVAELIRRHVGNICPGQPCWVDDGHVVEDDVYEQSKWYPAVQQNNLTSAEGLTRIIGALVQDLSCGVRFFDCEHIQTQSVFASTATRGLDFVMHSSSLNDDLDKLHKIATGKERDRAKCPLGHKNSMPNGGYGIPGTRTIDALIRQDKELMRKLCKVLMQDFVCFGFDLPPPCKDILPTHLSYHHH